MGDIFMDLVRSFGFVLDNIIYSLIPIIYKLFIYLSEINLFSMDESTPIGALIGRIYVFLGIFMLFKVTFSLVQYLIDPNAFSDKSKGFGKLVTNAMVTILLLVAVPYIFDYAMLLQNKIVTSNAIGTLIMGNSAGEVVSDVKTDEYGNEVATKLNTETVEEMATDVQFLMYGAFFSINPDAKLNGKSDVPNSCANTPIFGTVDMARNEPCLEDLKKEFEDGSKNDMAKYNVTLADFFKTMDESGNIDKSRNFSNFDKLLWWKDSDGKYVINYLPFVSAAAGLYVVFLLITFSIDIAVRAIKLCFLEMVAPIAIVSYIDPKESMSNSKLKNWIKECATTYFSLFLRIATLFLVMLLISVIASSVLAEDSYIAEQINDNAYNIWIYLFLIIGAFMFAKKVPQMIESIFGIKMSGDLSLNPFKSIRENAISNPLVSGAIGGAVGAGATALGAFGTSRNLGRGVGRSLLSAAGGLGSGMVRGMDAGAKSGGKNLVGNASKVAGQTSRAMELRGNTKMMDRIGARARNAVGAQSEYETLENRAKMYESVSGYAKAMEDRAKGELAKKDDNWKLLQAQRSRNEQDFASGKLSNAEYLHNLSYLHTEEDKLVSNYINNGGFNGEDAELAHSRDALDRVVRENKLDYDTSDWSQIDASSKKAKAQASDIRASDKYENAKAVHEMQKSGMMQSALKRK